MQRICINLMHIDLVLFLQDMMVGVNLNVGMYIIIDYQAQHLFGPIMIQQLKAVLKAWMLEFPQMASIS